MYDTTPHSGLTPLPNGEHPWAKGLRRSRRLSGMAQFALSVSLTICLLAGQVPQHLSQWVSARFGWPGLQALVFAAVIGFLYTAVAFPLGFVRGYLIEKRYGLSTQTPGGWLWDQMKGWLLGSILGAVIVLGLTAILTSAGVHWWWIAALAYMVFGIVLVRLAPQLIIPVFFKLKPVANTALVDRFKALAQRTRTPVLGIFEIDLSRRTRAANAAVVGLGATRRAIVGDTLLREFSADEIEFVLAHELGHHRHYDIWWGVLVSTVIELCALAATSFLLSRAPQSWQLPVPGSPFRAELLFWIALCLGVIGALLAPLVRAFSRYVEKRADAFAASATSHPQAGVAAFQRLGFQNLAVFRPPRWEEALFYTHPCIATRIARLASMAHRH